jgi:hypothetical protein
MEAITVAPAQAGAALFGAGGTHKTQTAPACAGPTRTV